MIIDTSAVMAILLEEPEQDQLIQALTREGSASISAGCWIELGAALTRGGRHHLFDLLDQSLPRFRIVVAPVTAFQATIGQSAYRRYGLGTGHPARLNFGDCFSYALAIETGEPLLFKGDDFVHTDVKRAA